MRRPRATGRVPAEFAAGVAAATPVTLGYLVIGFAAGVVARGAGMTVAEVALMSLLLYAGSAQFIAAGLVGAGAPMPAIVSTVFLVNLRHLLHSSALARILGPLAPRQAVLIGAELTDETFSVASTYARGGRRIVPAWMYGLNVTSQVSWIGANVAGALLGGAIPDPSVLGFHAVLPAMFAALLVLQLKAAGPRLPANLVVSAATAGAMLALVQVLSGGVALLLAAAAGATTGLALEARRRRPAGTSPRGGGGGDATGGGAGEPAGGPR